MVAGRRQNRGFRRLLPPLHDTFGHQLSCPADFNSCALILSGQRFRQPSVARGRRAFADKRCNICHGQLSSGAPDLLAGSRFYTGATMLSALWRHGPAMLAQMQSKAIPWPRFNGREMSDLIAYLNLHEKGKSHD